MLRNQAAKLRRSVPLQSLHQRQVKQGLSSAAPARQRRNRARKSSPFPCSADFGTLECAARPTVSEASPVRWSDRVNPNQNSKTHSLSLDRLCWGAHRTTGQDCMLRSLMRMGSVVPYFVLLERTCR